MPARRVLHHAAERGQIGHHAIQVHQHIVQLNAAVPQPEIVVQLIEHAPRVFRQAIPDRRRNPPDVVQHAAQPALCPLAEQQRRQLAFEIAQRHLLGQPRREQLHADQHLPQRHELGPVRRRILVGQPGDDAAHETHAVLGAFRMAPEPEQVVGHTAGQVGRPPFVPRRRTARAEQRGGGDRPFGDDPRVFAAAAAAKRNH